MALSAAVFSSLRASARRNETQLPPATPVNADSASAATGPWGTLEFEPVRLEESSRVFVDRAQRWQAPRWVFENYSPAQLTALLRSCGFTDAERDYLLNTSHWETLPNGFAISPPDQLVLSLSAASREHLYWSLATNAANYPQFVPFNFPADGFNERFAGSGLSAEKIELIRKLTYAGYGYLWLAVDRPLLQSFDTNELAGFVRALYGSPAWMLRLQVRHGADVDALVRYWGRGREKKVRPLLESLSQMPEGKTIDLGALLPPFAQERLDTFPDPEADPEANAEDCFYTAMNFFNESPDQRFTNIAQTRLALQSEYVPAASPGKFGDVLVLNDPAGNGIHACVYLADDFVFTKNGGNSDRPWVIMKIPEMLSCFPSEGQQKLVYWRRKGT